jgi:hypothetical protein
MHFLRQLGEAAVQTAFPGAVIGVVRYLHEVGTKVRIVSRDQGLAEDDGIEQIAADAHDERCVEAALAGADGAVNAISLYVEHGSDTFHSVHVEAAGKIAGAARQAGISRFVHISGIGANTASPSTYIRSRGDWLWHRTGSRISGETELARRRTSEEGRVGCDHRATARLSRTLRLEQDIAAFL